MSENEQGKTSPNREQEQRPDRICDHLTRAEMISELFALLSEVKNEDLPLVMERIKEIRK